MIRHISGVAEVVEDVDAAVGFYESLGIEVERVDDRYAVAKVTGILHFGIWDRRAAAESTYGEAAAAERVPLGFTLGIEVDDVDQAATKLPRVERDPSDEPWGQRTVRFLSPGGALCELTSTPWARELKTNVEPA